MSAIQADAQALESPWRDEIRATVSLSWPMVLTNLAQIAMTATDVMMMGWAGSRMLAAGALGSNLYFAPLIFGLGLMNAVAPMIATELGRNRRYGHSFSLAILELSGLESVTDRLGQAASDEVVRDIAAILKRHTRVIDACFRLAADEFAIVMPGTTLDGAKVLAERFRSQINEARGENIVGASFGVVAAGHESSDELIARANDESGKDNVSIIYIEGSSFAAATAPKKGRADLKPVGAPKQGGVHVHGGQPICHGQR